MNDRARAISILQQARDLLVERLTQKVVESEQEILADAAGDFYLSEIESIYDALGGRLAHVSSMLSNLPSAADHHSVDAMPPGPVYTDVAAAYASGGESSMAPLALALPSPPVMEERLQLSPPATFQVFAAQIQQGETEGAAHSLSELFGLDAARGRRCAEWFIENLSTHPDLYRKALRLRSELQAGNVHGSLLLLGECFGLEGLESLVVIQHLRGRTGGQQQS